MSWDVELAKNLNGGNNKESIGPILGDVISVEPLRISILTNKVILTEKHCYICSSLINNYQRKANIQLDTVAEHGAISTTGKITYAEVLKQGDKVMCLPTQNGQMFFIIDRVVI